MHTCLIREHVIPGRRLGRNVDHDPRSREYVARMVAQAVKLRTVAHRRYGGPLDQGNLGSCTGNAVAGAINTKPLHKTGGRLLTERDAVDLYELATRLDTFPGTYPPDDTGSSGLAAAKAARQSGYIAFYRHAFGIDQALRALQLAPIITGVNWYETFDRPTDQAFIRIGGQVRGGHEFEVLGYVAARDPYVICVNSWGPGWGLNGRFKLYVRDWARLLDEDGDVTILERR